MPCKHCLQIYFPVATCYNGIQLIKAWVPTQPIHIFVDCSNPMFDIKIMFLMNEAHLTTFPINWLDSMNHFNGW